MFSTVEIPVWLLVIVLLFAAWAALDRLLVPSVRWFLRRRVRRVLDDIGDRLDIDLPPFALTKRNVLIDRLTYDPEVQRAVEARMADEDMPRDVAMGEVERYAREIVPAFNAYVYFRVGYWFAKKMSRLMYRVRLGYSDDEGLRAVDASSTIVFIMNHRSNMDYVLAAFLAAEKTALSYAVGEWARIWPLQSLIKAMGGYFVRRNSGNPLYRKVLERYVHMATEGGVTQAVFPEGGLSRDGKLREPKLGLLDYMMRGFDPAGERDLVFVPVGINYDRVLEDRTLLLSLDPDRPKGSKGAAVRGSVKFLWRNIWLALTRRWFSYGYACVNFGSPISLRAYLADRDIGLAGLSDEARIENVQALAAHLMGSVGRVVPVLPVALIATVFRERRTLMLSEPEVKVAALSMMNDLDTSGALTYIPHKDRDYAINVGMRMLKLRHIVDETEEGFLEVSERNMPLLDYYANSISHLITK